MKFLFFFSSRRRHTRFDCDWSSDVCSSDLTAESGRGLKAGCRCAARSPGPRRAGSPASARRSEERRVGKSVDLGGRRIIKKKKKNEIKVKYTKKKKLNQIYTKKK